MPAPSYTNHTSLLVYPFAVLSSCLHISFCTTHNFGARPRSPRRVPLLYFPFTYSRLSKAHPIFPTISHLSLLSLRYGNSLIYPLYLSSRLSILILSSCLHISFCTTHNFGARPRSPRRVPLFVSPFSYYRLSQAHPILPTIYPLSLLAHRYGSSLTYPSYLSSRLSILYSLIMSSYHLLHHPQFRSAPPFTA